MHLYFRTYAVFPKPHHPEYGRIDGAYVSLFVRESLQSAAEAAAITFIEAEGWDIERLDKAYAVDIVRYPAGHPSRERSEQAQADGIVATFHRWPVGAPEDE